MAQQTLLIDTNIFLEFLLGQERDGECMQLMELVEEGAVEAYVTSFALHGIEISLERVDEVETLKSFLDWIIHTSRISVYHTSPQEELDIAILTETTGLDFDDALQYYTAKTLGAALVSFDHDFDDTDIQRLEPRAITDRTNPKNA